MNQLDVETVDQPAQLTNLGTRTSTNQQFRLHRFGQGDVPGGNAGSQRKVYR